jgi:hypothetical protein
MMKDYHINVFYSDEDACYVAEALHKNRWLAAGPSACW